jgi:predicted nucleotide-binding protein (sugar kinase/HSP70/actin superfamily)
MAKQRTPGDVEACFQEGAEKIRAARTPWSMRWALGKAKSAMKTIPLDHNRPTVRVVITGEVYCVIDPFANGQLEQRLAQLGAEPCRVLWQTDYMLHGMGLGRLGHLGGRPAAIRAARPYMAEDIGGDAAANVGHAVLAHRRGEDGLLHLKPFACMMEFISENVLRKVSEDLDFPVLSLTLDDVNGAERIHVRLEAFVENLFRRRTSRSAVHSGFPRGSI